MAIRNTKLLAWEIGCVIWVAVAGSCLHFAFELTGYWKPAAVMAAVNESAWEHTKMYFWPGFVYALVQYTYTRNIANNYWFGKAAGLAVTPLTIFACYFGYMAYVLAAGGKASLATMLAIMVLGIAAGQAASYFIVTARPLAGSMTRWAAPALAVLILMFSSFSYFPPRVFLFENFYCYTYTGEYGILPDYEAYRVFRKADASGTRAGGGVNYCKGRTPAAAGPSSIPKNVPAFG
jgi:hypothetical protein